MPPASMRDIVALALSRGWSPEAEGFWSLPPDAFGAGARPPTIVINVARQARQKVCALLCHSSQMQAVNPFSLLEPDEV